jgi:hypothetical protein
LFQTTDQDDFKESGAPKDIANKSCLVNGLETDCAEGSKPKEPTRLWLRGRTDSSRNFYTTAEPCNMNTT